MFFCHLFFTIGTMRMNLNSCVSFFIRHTLVDKQLFLQLTFILYFTLKKSYKFQCTITNSNVLRVCFYTTKIVVDPKIYIKYVIFQKQQGVTSKTP